jgi:hypothetical protein
VTALRNAPVSAATCISGAEFILCQSTFQITTFTLASLFFVALATNSPQLTRPQFCNFSPSVIAALGETDCEMGNHHVRPGSNRIARALVDGNGY